MKNMSKTKQSSIESSQINQYEEQSLSILRAHEAIRRNTPITLDESMTEVEMRIARRSQKLIQTSKILPIQPIGMDKLILKNLRTGQQKYAEFDSGTEHSSDQELKISYNVQQIVDLANKDPQAGKITFVAKLVRLLGLEFNYIVQNIKPKSHKQILQVHQIRSFGNFALYQINTDSSHKQITIHLKSGSKNMASSKVLSFAARGIYISEDLSYDFQIGTRLSINPLQGFIAACILEGERFCEQIIEISGKKAFKSYIINGDYKIDQHTKALINSSKSSVTFLKMLKFFLEEDERQFSKPTQSINKKTFRVLVKIYMKQILKFRTNPDSMQEGISQQQIVEYFELFLHFICLKQLEMVEIKFQPETQKQIKAKVSQIIKYSFRTGEVTLYHKFIKFCIGTGNFILQLGHDTINEYITEFSIKSPDAVQAGFQNILYHARNNQNKSKSVVNLLLQTFLKAIYQSSNIYQKHIRDILQLSSEVFMEIDPKTLNLQTFNYLYTVYYMFRSNKQLVGVARNQKLRSIITDFVSQLKERIQRGDQKQRLLGLSIIERFFITERDDELIGETIPLKNWIPYFFQSFFKNQKILLILVKLLLEMIKRTQTVFSQQMIRSISTSSCKTLQKLPIEDSLSIISKHFKEEYLHVQKAMQVISDYLIAPLVAKLLPQDQGTVNLLVNENHREWNHGFKYHLFINEMIVEKMLRIVNKIYKNSQFDKIQAIKKMKAEINRNVEDQNDKNSMRAIVQIQLIELSEEKLWEYFVEQRAYLKTLIKILKKSDQRSKELNSSLKKIVKALVNRKVPFKKIQQIKKMKPHEWHLFEELTNDHDIPNEINKIFEYGTNYINEMQRIKDFIREVGNKFKCPDAQAKIYQIQDFLSNFMKIEVIKSRIQQNFVLYGLLNPDVLKCYRLQSFFGPKQQKYMGKTIQQMITISNQLLDELNKHVNMIYASFEQKSLKSTSFYHFAPRKQNIKEFSSILCMNRAQIPDSIAEIVKIYHFITQSDQIFELFDGLIFVQAQKFRIKEPIIMKLFEQCSMLIKKKEFNISNILEDYEDAKRKLREYKLNIDDPQSKEMLELFAVLINHADIQSLLKIIQPSIKDLKQKIDDVGGQITYEDLEYCQYAIEFFSIVYNKNHNQFLEFMAEISSFTYNKKKINKNFSLSLILRRIRENSKNFKEEKQNFVDNSRSTLKIINGIAKKSTFEILNDEKNTDKVKSKIRYFDQAQQKVIYDNELGEAKEKSIILLSSAKQEDKDQKYKNLAPFIDICKSFQQLKENEQKLANWGYRQFETKPVVLNVENSKTDQFKKKLEQRESKLKTWKGKVKKLYDNNFKAAHLQGKKFKQFYTFIKSKDQEIPPQFRIINDKSKIHQQIKQQVKITEQKSPQDCLEQTIKYFAKLKEKVNQQKAEDFDQQFFHCKIVAKGQFDFIRGIQEIGPKRIQNLRFEHLLSCTKQTVQAQLKSFIERALRDPNNEYILLGFQNLDRKKQQYLIDEITSYKKELKEENQFKLKLCLIGDSKIDLLYKFAKQQLVEFNNTPQTIKQSEEAYRQKIIKNAKNVFVVSSKRAGLGKTTYIKQHSLAHFKCTQQYYVPLSGVMNVPSQNDNELSCQKFLWDRYIEIFKFFKSAQERKVKACLVIQIYNIQAPSIDSVNAFLCNLAIFKEHKYRNTPLKLQSDIPIYFELENISNSVKTQKKSNKPPQLNTLLVLRQLVEKGHKDIFHEIQRFACDHIKLQGNQKLAYILTFLKSLKDKSINTNFIGTFPNDIKAIPAAQARQLINEYFFSKFNLDDLPSGYLWTYFCQLLFQALGSFSQSIFLSSQLKQIDKDIQAKQPVLHKQLKLALTFREEFLSVLVENCHQFIQRSVKPGAEGQQSSLQETLKNLPFLIIPNIDGDSFSFIYNDSKKVPKTIKNLIVLQDPRLINQIRTRSIDDLFETVNIARIQKADSKQWKQVASQILMNISGNKNYRIDCEEGYIVNIDNFFKMCLITQRMRLNIPIVIMGEAGIGKTALLRHVVTHLYKHQFAVFNINAGLPLENKKNLNKQPQVQNNCNSSLTSMIAQIKRKFEMIPAGSSIKLWVFFDQFNTLRELGFFKQIIMDKRFLGQKQTAFQKIVMMAACNPHKTLKIKNEEQNFILEKGEKLAFDVLPAPHSLIESMWNYGALSSYEYQKYIGKMLSDIRYKEKQLPTLILRIHQYIKQQLHDSAVSLRDIDRLRQIYRWFHQNLPVLNAKNVQYILGSYNNREERALIMSIYFTYLLRFDQHRRGQLQKIVEYGLRLQQKYVIAAKTTEENDFCSRLNLKWDTPIALNNSLKQNIFTSFVCIYTHLPLLIIGTPGSSKSISLRLLHKNLSTSQQDEYLKKFKKLRQFQIQGSENSTTQEIKVVFQKAYSQLIDKQTKKPLTHEQMRDTFLVVFDQIGLAQKSPDNPLKVLHPYLQVNREENLSTRMLSFIGISNSELDVSKMSRLLVLRRPRSTKQDLQDTAAGIASGYQEQPLDQKVKLMIRLLTRSYFNYLQLWIGKGNNYRLFYGLRDFYSLIKDFMSKIIERKLQRDNNDGLVDCATESIFQNFNGWENSNYEFNEIFYDFLRSNEPFSHPTTTEIVNNLLRVLDRESNRYPMVIGQDEESLLFIKSIIQQRFKQRAVYMEGSPFQENKEYSLKLIGDIYRYIEGQNILILSNLKEGVKTGLYDFFNKSFNVLDDGRRILKVKTGTQSYKMHHYNERFNCIYLLLRKDLLNVEPPFLSRFQKYRFSLSEYRNENCGNLFQRIEKFGRRIEEICVSSNLKHYKFKDLFVNVHQKSLQSLTVASYLEIINQKNQIRQMDNGEGNNEQYYREAIKRLIMNSGQEFYFLFKYIVEKKGELAQLKQLIDETIKSKNEKQGERKFIIRFTTDADYVKKYAKSADNHCIQFETFRKQADIIDQLNSFLTHNKRKNMYIMMKVLEHSKNLSFIISEISRVLNRARIQNKNVNEKRIRIVFLMQKNRIDAENGKNVQQIVISHFTSYNQEFDDGKIGEIQNSKEELFKSVIRMQKILKLVHPIFQFQLENPNNIKLAQNLIKNIMTQFEMSSNSLFQKHCQEIVCTLQSNFEVNQESIKELMMDKQAMGKQQSFKEALTRYFADKKLFGPVGVFLKYLFDKQAYFSYSQQFLGRFIESQAFHLGQEDLVQFQRARKSQGYQEFMKDIFKVKSPFIKTEYNNVKMQKRMPNPNRRYTIKVSRPRLIPYSKVQCQTLLNFNQKELGWMAKQIYLHKEEQKNYQAYDAYANELKKKTSFKNPKYNFYSKYFDEDKNLKTMLFYDLLADFLTLRGLPIRFVPRFYEVMAPIIYLQENNVKFAKMVAILLGFEDIWIELFKIVSTFYQQDSVLEVSRFRSRTKTLSVEVLKQYCQYIIDQIVNCLLDPNCLKSRFNADKFCRVVVNSLFHIEKLEKKLQLNTSRELLKLISIRTALVFLELYDPANKTQNVQNFITKIAQNQRLNYYQIALSIFDALKEQAKPEQIKLINQFEANTLFLEWLKQKDPSKKNLHQFIIKCTKDENFAHNSVATLNHFVQVLKPQYRDIMTCFKKLNNRQEKDGSVIDQLLFIGEESNKKKFKDNLSIVIINMFMQKIVAAFEKGDILQQKAKEFEDLLTKLQTGQVYGVAKHFIFAFVKVYLENYIDKFTRDDVNYRRTYDLMDKILSNETSEYCSNFRFFCAKLLRTRMPIKQIKTEYVKKKKCKWITLIENKLDVFFENESRSIIVPKVTSSTSQNLKDIIKSIMENDGKPDRFDELIVAGCNSPFNRYCLFNFFLRFYFSMLYNHKAYKASVISKLQKQKAKYEQAIGQIQFQLIWRYANNKFDDNIQIEAPQQFSEDRIVFFNNFNWLLAIKQASSPLNSLFFQQGGKLHKNFINAFQNQFFPCGPENPYINIAQTVYELTRNNDIGVYLCSSKCDVLYCHQNCGWPNETLKCPICAQPIGCKPGKSHQVVKDEQGARRIMSPQLKDAGGNFYMGSLSKVPFFFDAQRCYIQAQINRMKQKTEVVASGKQVKLTGYQVQNQGRVSSLTYYIVRQILNSTLYCLTSMKLINPEEVVNLFKVKDYQQAKTYIWNKHTDDINYIKKALNLDNKIYGWIYGVHSFIFETCLNFRSNFDSYIIQTETRANQLIKNIENGMVQKTIKDVYFQIFKDFMNSLRTGLITKQLVSVTIYSAHNRFTRDIFQILLERFIKKATSQEKFRLAEQSFELQGCMQFPNDIYLTEDKIDQEKFQFSKLFKLPDKVIRYNEIVVSFQLLIRQQYPFLDYLLKNCEQINSMNDFRNILLFSNYLFAEVTNTFERIDAQKPIGKFIQELKDQKQHQMQSILKQPEIVITSWNKLAKRLGQLQYKCTPMGKMNDQYSLQTPVKAFLIDNVSKKNAFGLTLSVIFCNFAEMHNDIVNILNTKKNQIPQYKCLNLLDQNLLLSTQNFKESDVYIITEKQLEEKLYEFSISSINYGRNFIFTNFQSYQQYFIMKLLGKGLFNTNIEELKSICYNGEAFAKTSEYSNTLTQIKSYFDTPLTDNQKRHVRQTLRKKDHIKQRQECAIKIRGDLERIMIIIKKSNGLVDAKNIQDFKNNYQVAYSIIQTNQFEEIEVTKIVALYEQLELEMKPSVLQKLHKDYKFKFQAQEQQQLRETFNILPLEENDESVTLSEFGYALYRFIARNLQGNMVENDVNLLAFLPEREDFWPRGFDVYTKLSLLTQSTVLSTLTLKHVCAVFSIVEQLIHQKVGQSKI